MSAQKEAEIKTFQRVGTFRVLERACLEGRLCCIEMQLFTGDRYFYRVTEEGGVYSVTIHRYKDTIPSEDK